MVSSWSWSNRKSPKLSRTLLSILTDFSNAVVSMVSTRPLISKSSNCSSNPLVAVPSPPIIISITVTFMFHSFFNSLAGSQYLLFAFFQFYSVISWQFSSSCWLSVGLIVLPKFRDSLVSEKCLCLILLDRFWVVHINFIRMVKFIIIIIIIIIIT